MSYKVYSQSICMLCGFIPFRLIPFENKHSLVLCNSLKRIRQTHFVVVRLVLTNRKTTNHRPIFREFYSYCLDTILPFRLTFSLPFISMRPKNNITYFKLKRNKISETNHVVCSVNKRNSPF